MSQCSTCQTYVLNPQPPLSEILKSYETGTTFQRWQEETEIRTVLWRKRLELLRQHQASGRLLDVGTGDGFFPASAGEVYSITCTEITEQGRHFAHQRGIYPLSGEFTEIPLPTAEYDLITLWHVLEHFSEPGLALRHAYTLLKPGGLLAVAVPNELRWVWQGRTRTRLRKRPCPNPFPKITWGEEVHLTYFTPASFRNIIKQTGFIPVSFGVDDVELTPTIPSRVKCTLNQWMSKLTGQHLSQAMILLARKSGEKTDS